MPDPLRPVAQTALLVLALPLSTSAGQLAMTASKVPPRQAAAVSIDRVTGTWIGGLEAEGTRLRLAFVLRLRESGDVLGYAMGGAGVWSMVAGHLDRGRLQVTLEWEHTGGSGTVQVDGVVQGNAFAGTADDGGGPVPFRMRRRTDVLTERRFLVGGQVGASGGALLLAPVLNGAGGLVAGCFAGFDDETCAFLGCAGRLTAFVESGGSLLASVHVGGGCPLDADFVATLDPTTLFYAGTWSSTGCGGPASGPLIGARSTGTRSDHVQEILGALDEIGGQLESGTVFGASNPNVSPGFLHFGRTAADLLTALDLELATYSRIEARFRRIDSIATVDEPFTLPELALAHGAVFEEVRSGVPLAGGPRETYLDTRAAPVLPLMHEWREEGGRWRIAGNQLPGLELPLTYALGSSELEIPTPGGTVYASVGPWGGHFSPVGNHTPGDAKTSLIGFLTEDDGDLSELVGNGNGVFELGETWGYWGGPNGDLVRDKTPQFVAPWDGVVSEVLYSEGPNPFFFDDPPQWEVVLELPGDVRMALKHVAGVDEPLRQRVLAATGIDPGTFAGAPGTELLNGVRIPVTSGEALGHPQIVAAEIAGFPGWYGGGGAHPDRPWATMEIYTNAPLGRRGGSVSVYDLLAPAERAALQAVVDADATHPKSQRYWTYEARRWMWSAETRVSMAHTNEPRDFSSLYTSLGGWIEVDGAATSSDEMVAFCPIADDVAGYDPSLYDPSNAGWLLTRERAYSVPFLWTMPDGSTLTAHYPTAAEVLDLQADQLLLKWRDVGYAPGGGPEVPVYQRAAYVLDANGLRVAWGVFASSPAGAVLPTLLPGDPCDDLDLICYDHSHQPGY